jgi:predicted ATPase
MREAVALMHKQGIVVIVSLADPGLAEAEGKEGNVDTAISILENVFSEIERTGQRWLEAEAHRIHGEILLKGDAANTAPAEEAFLAAIAIAQQQKAKSFELRAALSLAKLYQSANRAADAHTVLAPALEGFSPTPEFPEIEEAQKLLVALAETDEVKNATASRQRRLKLQTSYGRALMWSKGFGSEESRAAFARAREIAASIDDASERFSAYYGQWAGCYLRSELASARELAEVLLLEAGQNARTPEATTAHRASGIISFMQGKLADAEAELEEALRICDRDWSRDQKLCFGMDSGAVAAIVLANVAWCDGKVAGVRILIEEAMALAHESAHAPTIANTCLYKAIVETMRGDAATTLRDALPLIELSREHGLALYLAGATILVGWARARLGERAAGIHEFCQGLERWAEAGCKTGVPYFQGLLAEIESEEQGGDRSLARIDEALMLASETGERWSDALLHRIRGGILLKRDPADSAPAEEAFLTAITIAREQKARSFELRAALSLAKLYQSANRAADAHAVLAPALEGFSPTPEFPEIEQAQAALARLMD